jgi:hypothetical protein
MRFLAGKLLEMYVRPEQTKLLSSHKGGVRRDMCELWRLQSQICQLGRAAFLGGSLRRPERGRARLALKGAAGGSRERIDVSELAPGRPILLIAGIDV